MRIGDKAGAFELIRDLDRQARVYADLRAPETGSWTPDERDSLAQLQMFNVRQPLSVLLAVFDRFAETDRAEFGRFLRAVAMVSFRYNVICGRKSNEQEAMYNRIAREVSDGRITRVATAIEALRPVYPQDAEFRAAFAEKTLRTTSSRNRKLARFILFKLEEKLSGNSFEFESAKYDIEHVLPENPDEDWGQFDEQQREASTHRLGNMTLLESASNRELGNKGFADKRRVFLDSEFAVTRKLAQESDTWTMDRIRSRQGWMAKQATSIWQVGL